jgi:hypothetical protein
MQTKNIGGESRDNGGAPGAATESPAVAEAGSLHELGQRILRLEGDLRVRDREEQAARREVGRLSRQLEELRGVEVERGRAKAEAERGRAEAEHDRARRRPNGR